jgi:hypothetical protein
MMIGLSLRAPIAVPVEVRAPARRVFRLALDVGEDGLRLARPLPFEPGRPVEVRLVLPQAAGADEGLALRAEVGAPERSDEDEGGAGAEPLPTQLHFLDPPESARAALRRYVHERLELPAPS